MRYTNINCIILEQIQDLESVLTCILLLLSIPIMGSNYTDSVYPLSELPHYVLLLCLMPPSAKGRTRQK